MPNITINVKVSRAMLMEKAKILIEKAIDEALIEAAFKINEEAWEIYRMFLIRMCVKDAYKIAIGREYPMIDLTKTA